MKMSIIIWSQRDFNKKNLKMIILTSPHQKYKNNIFESDYTHLVSARLQQKIFENEYNYLVSFGLL